MDWFFANGKGLITFAQAMSGKPDEAYVSEFVRCIFDFFWGTLLRKVVYLRMLPFVGLVCS